MDEENEEFDFHKIYPMSELRGAIPGRGFKLRMCLLKGSRIELRSSHLMEIIEMAIKWHGKAQWAYIADHEGRTVLSKQLIVRLWAAAQNCYGIPSEESPFIVVGPTINPRFVELYHTDDLLRAIQFVVQWQESGWEDPYWAVVKGPNGKVIMGTKVTERLFHAVMKSWGESITISVVRPSEQAIVTDYGVVRLPEVMSRHRVV